MPFDIKPNQNFVKFISVQGDKKKLNNLQMILDLERKYPEMFIRVMANFDEVMQYKETLDEDGKPVILSWEETLKKFYSNTKYVGVTPENEDIAEVFGRKGLSQKYFNEASLLRKGFKIEKVPEHILGKPLKEETILESIERIKEQTASELINGKEMIDELFDKQFTYEWLSKNDPHNSILGLFCSCCCSITSEFYGSEIAVESILAPDLQNLVVRDSNGNIVAKGTMYVNKEKSYAIINDFELNEKYKRHQMTAGDYLADDSDKDEKERELIFKAFQRGIKAFVEEYDKQNPNNPLKKVNVGMGYNRLKRQVERFEKETNNLTVPSKYCFEDTRQEQYILYEREDNYTDIEESERY